MKVTFEIEIDDSQIQSLDYYENYGEVGSLGAGCKKCIFQPMCGYITGKLGDMVGLANLDCKFPCWKSKLDRISKTNRKVFVFTNNDVKL